MIFPQAVCVANGARLRWPLRGTKHAGMIVMHTPEQLEQARLALEQRGPQVLAAFILTLIHEPNGIGSYVHAFTRADDLNAASEGGDRIMRSARMCTQRS